MKITRTQLKQLIKEQLSLNENEDKVAPWGRRADGTPEHHLGSGEPDGRGAHDNRRRDADGKPIGKNVDVFGRVVKDDDELEEACDDDEIQELLDPEAEKAPERVKRLSDAETAREKKKNDSDMAKEEDGKQLEEILKKVISIVREQKMKGKSKN